VVHATRRQSQEPLMPVKSSHVMGRPVRLFHPPRPIDGVNLSPEPVAVPGREKVSQGVSLNRASVPVCLQIDRRRFRVARYWGPERIETGWWRGPTVRRDYWKVEFETRQQFWIYFDWKRKEWFLQGEF